MEIGERIKNRRKELGLTLEEIGNEVGVSKSTVRKWETGYIANMRRDKIQKLAHALQMSPIELIGIEEPEIPKVTEPRNLYDENGNRRFDYERRVRQPVFEAYKSFLLKWIKLAEEKNMGVLELLDSMDTSPCILLDNFLERNPESASFFNGENDVSICKDLVELELRKSQKSHLTDDSSFYRLLEKILRLSPEERKSVLNGTMSIFDDKATNSNVQE